VLRLVVTQGMKPVIGLPRDLAALALDACSHRSYQISAHNPRRLFYFGAALLACLLQMRHAIHSSFAN
jgi:hypothetical protein